MPIIRYIPPGDVRLELNELTGKKELVLLSGTSYVKQKLKTRFKFFAGEWFRNANEGVRYRRDVFVKNPDLEVLRSTFREIIRSVLEVDTIQKFELLYDIDNRILYFDFALDLTSGDVLVVAPNDRSFLIDFRRTT